MTALVQALRAIPAPAISWRSAWTLSAAIVLAIAVFDWPALPERLSEALASLAGTAPFVLFAVAAIGFLRATQSEALVARAFQGRESRMIVLAALIGGLAPFCSCEVIPFVAALLAAGTPISAVMAFWLSSPLMDPPSFAITAGALGWDYALAKAVGAVGVGLMGGFAMKALCAGGWFADPLRPRASAGGGCGSCCGAPAPEPVVRWDFWREAERREAFGRLALENGLFLLKWLLLAYLLQAVMVAYVPAEAIASMVGGDGIGAVLIGALVGAPAYLNGYAAPPLVAGLMEQGMGAGPAMAFMMAGGMTCIPALAAVYALVRRPVFGAYLGFSYAGAVLAGLAFGLYA